MTDLPPAPRRPGDSARASAPAGSWTRPPSAEVPAPPSGGPATGADGAAFTPPAGPGSGAARAAAAPPAGAGERGRVGRYLVVGELGRGGMGVVLRGWDPGLHRDVAIKMILETGASSRHAVERFVREARATARLRHPGIVAIHEVGEHEGRPFIVMDLVDGEPLDRRLEREKPPPREAARIVRELALALDHAHAAGVIHRDVKPQNAMLDRAGRALLTDFGAARDLASGGNLTVTGQLIGTPVYMSPEQARGDHDRTGPASDVYSLGAVLYHALVGRPPFGHRGEGLAELLAEVIRADPEAPRRIDASVHADLETIALRCLRKEPDRRYASAGELAADLQRFLDGEAILARPIGRRERARRWVRRNRVHAASLGLLGAALLASLVAGVAFGVWSIGKIRLERDAAARARDAERTQREAAEAERERAEAERARAAAAEAQARGALDHTERLLARAMAERAENFARRGADAVACALAAESLARLESSQARSVLARALDDPVRVGWISPSATVTCLAWTPDGRRLLTGTRGGEVSVWDPRTGLEVGRLSGHLDEVTAVAVAADGETVATSAADGTVRLWSLEALSQIEAFPFREQQVTHLGWSPDGARLVVCAGEADPWVFGRGEQPTVRLTGHRGAVTAVAWSPDGGLIATAGADRTVRLFDGRDASARGVLDGHRGIPRAIAWRGDGARLATAGEAGDVRLWDPRLPREVAALPGQHGPALAVAWSPDGRTLATGGGGGIITLFDETTDYDGTLRGHAADLRALAFSPDGATLASCDALGTLRLWDMTTARERARLDGHGGPVAAVAWARDGSWVATAGADATVRFWDPRSGQTLNVHRVPNGMSVMSITDAGGGRVAFGDVAGWVHLLDRRRGMVRSRRVHADIVFAIALGPDGRTIASGGTDGKIHLLDAATLDSIGEIDDPHDHVVGSIAWSPDGGKIAAGSLKAPDLHVYDVAERRMIDGWSAEAFGVYAVAWRPDGEAIASTGEDGDIHIWTPRGGDLGTSPRRGDAVQTLRWSPDGETLASGSQDGQVWLLGLGRRPDRLITGHRGWVRGLAFSPRGDALATGGRDGTVRVWDLSPRGEMKRTLRHGEAEIVATRWSPDGARLLSADATGELRLWIPGGALAWRHAAEPARGRVSDVAWSPDGRRLAAHFDNEELHVLDPAGEAAPVVIPRLPVGLALRWPSPGVLVTVTDRGAQRWDPTSGRPLEGLRLPAVVTRRACSDDARYYAWASQRSVRVFDVRTGALAREATAAGVVAAMRFDPASERLAWGTDDGRVEVLDLEDPSAEPFTLPGRQQAINALAWSRDGRLIASASRGAEIWTREARTGRLISRLATGRHGVRRLAFGRDDHELAAGLTDGTVRLIDARGVSEVAVLGDGRTTGVFDWRPDGAMLATGASDGIVHVWDLAAIQLPADRLVERVFELTGLRVQGLEPVPVTNRLTLVGR